LTWKYKKVKWRRNLCVWVVKLVWVTSTGLACSAAVEPGSTLLFSSKKANWMSAICKSISEKTRA